MKTSKLSAVIKTASVIRNFIVVATIITAISTYLLNAAYLQNIPQTITQPDGSIINCFASGDEFYNYLHDAEGYTIIKDQKTGFYVYADKVGIDLIPTDLIVGKNKPQSIGLRPKLLHSQEHIANKRMNWLDATEYSQSHQKQQNNLQGKSPLDTINQIVILVTWKNGPAFYYPLSYYDTIYNYGPNSFKAYWKEVSYNQLTVNTYLYQYQSPYTRSSITSGTSCYGAFIKDIITNIADSVSQNLKIDSDGDGFVDNISVILQGVPVGWANILWPHSVGDHSFLKGNAGLGLGYSPADCNNYVVTSSSTYKFGPIRGKYLNTFNLNFEFGNYTIGGQVPPKMLDILCHEFFHTFGSPDLYVNAGINRVGNWSLMSNGGNYITMYERHKYGQWIDSIPTIKSNGTYTMHHCKQNVAKNTYMINCPNNTNYCFILELRNLNKEFNVSNMSTYPNENTGILIYRINKNRAGHGNYYGDSSGTKGEMYVYRAGGTNTATGYINKALYNNNYTHNGVIRNTISDNTTNLTTSFLENGGASGLHISNISIYSGGDSVMFTVGAYSPSPKYTIIASAGKGGTISSNPNNLVNLDSGAIVSLTALSNTGYRFTNWTRVGTTTIISSNNPYIFNITKSDTLVGNFVPVSYTITYNLNGGVGNMSPAVYTIESSTITLPVPVKSGNTFKGWYNNSSLIGNPITSIVQGSTGNKVFYAKWDTIISSNQFTLTLLAEPSNLGSIISWKAFTAGNPVSLLAIPNSGARFVKWTNNGVDYSFNANITIVVNSNITLVAHFALINTITTTKYQVAVAVNPKEGGSVSGAGQYDSNATCQLIATPANDYMFIGYYLNNRLVSLNPDYAFVVNKNINYEARFRKNIFPAFQENIKSTTLLVMPNPTSEDFNISFDILKSANIQITLLDLAGREVLHIYDDWATVGTFSKTIKTNKLQKGIYFLRLFIEENIIVEKIVVN